MNTREASNLALRYCVLIFLGMFNLAIFYFVFTPLTVEGTILALRLFGENATNVGSSIFYHNMQADLIPACVGGAAYYLLLILNLSTEMKKTQRMKSILFLCATFLIVNIARIVFFLKLSTNAPVYFDAAHLATWYFGSTIFVVLIWFVNVYVFNIEKIPMYSDVKRLFNESVSKKHFRKRTQ